MRGICFQRLVAPFIRHVRSYTRPVTSIPLLQAMKRFVVALALALSPLALAVGGIDFAAANDVTWDALGTDENSSMPLGNGDLALNVWTEQN